MAALGAFPALTLEAKRRAGTAVAGKAAAGSIPWLGIAGIGLQALAANSEDAERERLMNEQQEQAKIDRVHEQELMRRQLQEQSMNRFNNERALNMDALTQLAGMRSRAEQMRRSYSFRNDLLKAVGV